MKKSAKVFLYIILILVVISTILFFGLDPILRKFINNKLSEKPIAGIYKGEIKHAYLNIFQMGISLKGIEIHADSSEESLEQYKYHKNIAQVHINTFTLAHIDLIKLIKKNEIDISKIRISKPEIKVFKNLDFEAPLPKIEDSTKSVSKIEKLFFESIIIKGLSLEYYISTTKTPDISIRSIDMQMNEPIIDPNELQDIGKAILIKDFTVQIKDVNFKDPKGLYGISLDKIVIKDSASIIHLNDLRIKPLLDKKKFAAKFKHQSDRFDGKVKEIIITGIDLNKYIVDQELIIEHIQVSGLDLEVYRNKNYPFNFNNYPKLPQEAIRSIKPSIEIKSIDLSDGDIIYSELEVDALKSGKVVFKDIQAQIKNFGNSEEWQKEKILSITAQAKIYGKGNLHAQFDFPLSSNTFTFSGDLGKTPLNVVNEISVNSAGVKVREGVLNKMTFQFTANNVQSKGKVELYYKDLNVALLKHADKTGELKERKMINFVANSLIVPPQNPNENGEFYSATGGFEKHVNKGIFNYLWKSLFSGIKDTFLKNNQLESLQSQLDDNPDKELTKKEEKTLKKELKKQSKKDKK